jgi:hypothetical protein
MFCFHDVPRLNALWGGHICLIAHFISETTEWIMTIFAIMPLHQMFSTSLMLENMCVPLGYVFLSCFSVPTKRNKVKKLVS